MDSQGSSIENNSIVLPVVTLHPSSGIRSTEAVRKPPKIQLNNLVSYQAADGRP
jgi:hypothetical protein